ncbi:thermonuclease family protein [Magnetospira sp. QH-2]|uniref:thermonuclease family protein n=1 Tax=Magnetospira sp. (strain QH-2) TaxID=1288970 RepID=UPI0003E818DC|nr:thermonuclease family protein [Magnetospira sp. QH-2]CCQ73176.1 Conserved protein of unknown function. Putative nuclease domain protein [Magnetospira sp. QH-2]
MWGPRIVALSMLLMSLLVAGQAEAFNMSMASGRAQVLAADMLRVNGQTFCLMGIKAPAPGLSCFTRSGKTFECNRIAATGLMDLTAGTQVTCKTFGDRRADGCPLARCEANRYDLSKGMVYTGWAQADPETAPQLLKVEHQARERGHGIWTNGGPKE